MQKISYIMGNQYGFVMIPRKEAEYLNIENPENVKITVTHNGITIKNTRVEGGINSQPREQIDTPTLVSDGAYD